MHREAARAALRCGLPEPAALDDREQDRSHPLRIVRARVIRGLRDISRFAEKVLEQFPEFLEFKSRRSEKGESAGTHGESRSARVESLVAD